MTAYFASHAQEIPSFRSFEKCIFSAVCGKTKTSSETFEYLCSERGIAPKEKFFVDDSLINIEGAERIGIKGYLFDGDVPRLEKYLSEQFEQN